MLSLLVKQELITFLFHNYYAMETVIIVNSLPSKQKKMFDLSDYKQREGLWDWNGWNLERNECMYHLCCFFLEI